MSTITIGLTQEYTQIEVQGITDIVLPEWTGSPTNQLSRKIIMLVEPVGLTDAISILWTMEKGAADVVAPTDPSTALITWADNKPLAAIGGNSSPETIIVELWEAEIPSGGFGWYGKWTGYSTNTPSLTPITTSIQLFTPGSLTPSGQHNYGNSVMINNTVQFTQGDSIMVHTQTPPTGTDATYTVIVDSVVEGIQFLGSVTVAVGAVGSNIGGTIVTDYLAQSGDLIFLGNLTGGGNQENVTVSFQGCMTPTSCG